MNTTGNTILITGGGTGIGRALAERFHAAGNSVIIAGRRAEPLAAVVAAHPGMRYRTVDVADPAALDAFAETLLREEPALNVVIHNAGIMVPEDVQGGSDAAVIERTVAINLLAPLRLTRALLPHLMTQPGATVMTVSSGLAFVPLALTPTYSATKAAIHSWSQSLRHQLEGTGVSVIELAPPYVQTGLMGPDQAVDPRAMPLEEFIDEVMAILSAGPVEEVIVGRCRFLRHAEAEGRHAEAFATVNALH